MTTKRYLMERLRYREQLRTEIAKAYDDAMQAAVNPFLANTLSDKDGPWELQHKIKKAIEIRKEQTLKLWSLL